MTKRLEQSTWTLPPLDQDARLRVPVLTVISHPDVRRIGEVAWLDALATDPQASVAIGRAGPRFAQPGSGAAGAPLGDPYLSRDVGALIAERDAIALHPGARRQVLASGPADGSGPVSPCSGPVRLTEAALDAGWVLCLNNVDGAGAVRARVVLLLHRRDLPVAGEGPAAHGLIGQSEALDRLRAEISRVASTETSVLIRGETGAGKELVARAIHAASARRSGPLVAANVAELHGATGRSELFGHERGAFTGADRAHSGLFEQARGGALFLDEVGEARPEIQTMLLRALEQRVIRRLGGSRDTHVDLRVLAATDRDLESATSEGGFHAALLNRLQGYVIHVPALRDRRDDLARLAVHFALAARAEQAGRPAGELPADWLAPEVMTRLVTQPWPGNVRELANVMRQLVIGNQDRARLRITEGVERLLADVDGDRPSDRARGMHPGAVVPAELDDAALIAALERHGFRPGPAAAELGLARSTIYRLIDGCAALRKAKDIPAAEFSAAWRAAKGDAAALVPVMRASERALLLRASELGLR